MRCSCVIAIFNERSRIGDVLVEVARIPEISEIICVDDGSTDGSFEFIKQHYPKIQCIRHPRNLGKASAIRTGLTKATHETILLLDSDLKNLKADEISLALNKFQDYKLDCLLLNTAPMNVLDFSLRIIFRFLLCSAGNRIIKKKYLRESLAIKNPKNYQLEIAQSKYLMDHHKNVAYFDISAIDISKIDKKGWIIGLIDEYKMWKEIINFAGFGFFLKQSFFFAREKI